MGKGSETRLIIKELRIVNIIREEMVRGLLDIFHNDISMVPGRDCWKQYCLGALYVNPESEVYDLKKSMEYLEAAAAQENEYAYCKLGIYIYIS